MPSIYQLRRPRASLLWQVVHHGWSDFLAQYKAKCKSPRQWNISKVEFRWLNAALQLP